MNLFEQCYQQPTRRAVTLCFALAISGCSGSNAPVQDFATEGSDLPSNGLTDDVPATDATADAPSNGVTTDESSNGLTTDEPSAGATTDEPSAGSTTDVPSAGSTTDVPSAGATTDVPSTGATTDEPSAGATTDVPDPMVQNNTDVSFEITVPAYQSNELQLQLSWGEFSASLNWVGDELWSVEAELPTNTEQLLSIVFVDENGGIELGSFNQQYRTGINAAEVFQVTADQFNTNQLDFDGDGHSNLDELIAGTDPRVDEDSLLTVVDNQPMSLVFVANYFESLLSNERPYMGTDDDSLSEYAGTSATAEIDANGNGSLFAFTLPHVRNNRRNGERLALENSVQWNGSWSFSDDFHLNQTFTSEVSADGDTRRLVEEGSGSWTGTFSHRWNTVVDVTGQLIEGSDYCEVHSGTITETYTTNQDGISTTTLTITRESVDDLWRVENVTEREGGISSGEYLARELSMHMIRFGYQRQVSENDHFFCDIVDL